MSIKSKELYSHLSNGSDFKLLAGKKVRSRQLFSCENSGKSYLGAARSKELLRAVVLATAMPLTFAGTVHGQLISSTFAPSGDSEAASGGWDKDMNVAWKRGGSASAEIWETTDISGFEQRATFLNNSKSIVTISLLSDVNVGGISTNLTSSQAKELNIVRGDDTDFSLVNRASIDNPFTIQTDGLGSQAKVLNLKVGIKGDGVLIKTGARTLSLQEQNTYTGKTTIQEGNLVISGANGQIANTESVEVKGGVLTLASVGNEFEGGRINDAAVVTLNDLSSFEINSFEEIAGLSSSTGAPTTILNGSANLALNVASSTSHTYSGKISASEISSLTKKGSGTQQLRGDMSDFKGYLSIEQGRLDVLNNSTLGAADSKLVMNGGELNIIQDGVTVTKNIALNSSSAATSSFFVSVDKSTTLTGEVTGTANQTFAKSGDGVLTITGNQNHKAEELAVKRGELKLIQSSGAGTYFDVNRTSIDLGAALTLGDGASGLTGANYLKDDASVKNDGTINVFVNEEIGSLSSTETTSMLVMADGKELTINASTSTDDDVGNTYSGKISGSANVVFSRLDSAGETITKQHILTNANTYSGKTTVEKSTLMLSGTNGSLGFTSSVLIKSDGTLVLASGKSDRINDSANVELLGNLSLKDNEKIAALHNGLVDGANATLSLDSGKTLTITNEANASSTDDVYNSEAAFFGSISGDGGNIKIEDNGASNPSVRHKIQYLGGNNSYSGTTTIDRGVLGITRQSAVGNTSKVKLMNNGRLLFLDPGNVTFSSNFDKSISVESGGGLLGVSAGATVLMSSSISNVGGPLNVLEVYGGGKLVYSGVSNFNAELKVNNTIFELSGTSAQLDQVSKITVEGADGVLSVGLNTRNAINDLAEIEINDSAKFLVNSDETVGSLTNNTASATGSVSIASDVQLVLKSTDETIKDFDGSISGFGSLVKSGSGQQRLFGTNNFAGDLVIEDGELTVQSSASLGSSSLGNVVLNGGTLGIAKKNVDENTLNFDLTRSMKVGNDGGKIRSSFNSLVTLSSDVQDTTDTDAEYGTLELTGDGSFYVKTNLSNKGVINITNQGFVSVLGSAGEEQTGFAATKKVTIGSSSTLNLNSLAGSMINDNANVEVNGKLMVRVSETVGSLSNTVTPNCSPEGATGAIELSNQTVLSTNNASNEEDTFAGCLVEAAPDSQSAVVVGSFTKGGAGTQTFTGNNTIKGVLTADAGTLKIKGASGQFNSVSKIVVNSPGTLEVDGNAGERLSDTAEVIVNGQLILNQNETLSGLKGTSQTGKVTIADGKVLTLSNNESAELTFSGSISGDGGFTKSGNYIQVLNGDSTYSSKTTIAAGELKISNGGKLSGTSEISIDQNAKLTIFSDSVEGSDLLRNGVTVENSGVFNVNAKETIGALKGTITGAKAVLSKDLTLKFETTEMEYAGQVEGTGALIKDGSGTQVLSGALSHSGGTRVLGGELRLTLDQTTLAGETEVSNAKLTTQNEITLNKLKVSGIASIDVKGDMLTVSGDIAGTGELKKLGAGDFNVVSDATLSGKITIDSGSVIVMGDGKLNSVSEINIGNMTTLQVDAAIFERLNDEAIVNNNGELELSLSEKVGGLRGSNAAAVVSLANGTVFTVGNDDTNPLVYSGKITGEGGFTKKGTFTQVLDKSTSDYSGKTTIEGGTLKLEKEAKLSSTSEVSISSGGKLFLLSDLDTSDDFLNNGAMITNDGKLDVQANETIGPLYGVEATATTLIGKSLTLDFGDKSGDYAGSTLGAGNLIKKGTGKQTIRGDLSHTGKTQVLAGELHLKSDGNQKVTSDVEVTDAKLSSMGDVSLKNIRFAEVSQVSVEAGKMSVTGVVSGDGGLNKQGAGILHLSGANTYTGITLISAGTLELASNSALGQSENVTISNSTLKTLVDTQINAAIDLEGLATIDVQNAQTILSRVVSGEGNLRKLGDGKLILNAKNTYKGDTYIDGGTLSISSSEALGAGANVRIDDANLETTTSMVLNQTFQLGGVAGIDANTGTVSLSGKITGDGMLNKLGDGGLVLSGSNDFSGGTRLSGGTTEVQHAQALGRGPLYFSGGNLKIAETTDFNQNVQIEKNADVDVKASKSLTFGNTVSGPADITKSGDGDLVLSKENAQATGQLGVQAGGLTLKDGAGWGGNIKLEAGTRFVSQGVSGQIQQIETNSDISLGADNTLNVKKLYVQSQADLSMVDGAILNGDVEIGADSVFNAEGKQNGSLKVAGNLNIGAKNFENTRGVSLASGSQVNFRFYEKDKVSKLSSGGELNIADAVKLVISLDQQSYITVGTKYQLAIASSVVGGKNLQLEDGSERYVGRLSMSSGELSITYVDTFNELAPWEIEVMEKVGEELSKDKNIKEITGSLLSLKTDKNLRDPKFIGLVDMTKLKLIGLSDQKYREAIRQLLPNTSGKEAAMNMGFALDISDTIHSHIQDYRVLDDSPFNYDRIDGARVVASQQTVADSGVTTTQTTVTTRRTTTDSSGRQRTTQTVTQQSKLDNSPNLIAGADGSEVGSHVLTSYAPSPNSAGQSDELFPTGAISAARPWRIWMRGLANFENADSYMEEDTFYSSYDQYHLGAMLAADYFVLPNLVVGVNLNAASINASESIFNAPSETNSIAFGGGIYGAFSYGRASFSALANYHGITSDVSRDVSVLDDILEGSWQGDFLQFSFQGRARLAKQDNVNIIGFAQTDIGLFNRNAYEEKGDSIFISLDDYSRVSGLFQAGVEVAVDSIDLSGIRVNPFARGNLGYGLILNETKQIYHFGSDGQSTELFTAPRVGFKGEAMIGVEGSSVMGLGFSVGAKLGFGDKLINYGGEGTIRYAF